MFCYSSQCDGGLLFLLQYSTVQEETTSSDGSSKVGGTPYCTVARKEKE